MPAGRQTQTMRLIHLLFPKPILNQWHDSESQAPNLRGVRRGGRLEGGHVLDCRTWIAERGIRRFGAGNFPVADPRILSSRFNHCNLRSKYAATLCISPVARRKPQPRCRCAAKFLRRPRGRLAGDRGLWTVDSSSVHAPIFANLRVWGKDAAAALHGAAPARILRAGRPAHSPGNVNLNL